MAFHVISLETGEPVPLNPGEDIMVFSTGTAASQAARTLTQKTGKKHQPRRIFTDDKWEMREQEKFKDGTYEPLPWGNPASNSYAGGWFIRAHTKLKHYAHVSKGKVGMVAFTESEEKGRANIQTRMRPGTYLQRFYLNDIAAAVGGGPYADHWIRANATYFSSIYDEIQLHFATTANEIEHIYRAGPHSCMSYRPDEYNTPFHPVRVYAAGDLACAYITAAADSKTITARALCWPEKKTYGRIYGDDVRMKKAFADADYSYSAYFAEGARLVRHPINTRDNAFVCPYIDGILRVSDNGKHLIITENGELDAEVTDGTAGGGFRQYCSHCDEAVDPQDDDAACVEGNLWCPGCVETYAFYCNRYHQYYAYDSEEAVTIVDRGQTWCLSAAENHAWQCRATDDWYSQNTRSIVLNDGTVVCPDWFARNGFYCVECDANYRNDEHEEHSHEEKPREYAFPVQIGDIVQLHDTDVDFWRVISLSSNGQTIRIINTQNAQRRTWVPVNQVKRIIGRPTNQETAA